MFKRKIGLRFAGAGLCLVGLTKKKDLHVFTVLPFLLLHSLYFKSLVKHCKYTCPTPLAADRSKGGTFSKGHVTLAGYGILLKVNKKTDKETKISTFSLRNYVCVFLMCFPNSVFSCAVYDKTELA